MMSKFKLLVAGMVMIAASTQAQNMDNALALATTGAPAVEVTKGEKNTTVAAKPAAVSALMSTIDKGHIIDAKEMIKEGADVHATSADGQTALHVAARKGYIELVKKLLHEGADAKAQDVQGRTALDLVNETDYKFPREKRVITRLLTAEMAK